MTKKYAITIGFLVVFLLLTACSSIPPSHEGQMSGGHTVSKKDRALIVNDKSTETEIAFSIRDGDETFTNYGISHTKEMHLIVVRDDLRYFSHLHPERDNQGVWRTAFTAPAGGTFLRYADFVDRDLNPSTIRFDRKYPEDPGMHGIVKNFERVKTVDGYRFEMKSEISNNELTFTYKITDAQSQSVELEEYLGAMGHSVLISSLGDFIHTHATEEGETPVFATTKPSDDFYRVFTQFKIKGEVVTVKFDYDNLPHN